MKLEDLLQKHIYPILIWALGIGTLVIGFRHPFGYRYLFALALIFGLGTLMYRLLDERKN